MISQHLRSLRRRCAKLLEWIGGDTALAAAVTAVTDLPDTLPLEEVRTCLQRVVRRVLCAEDRDKLEALKVGMDKRWTTRRTEVYRWIQGQEDRPVTVLARPDGTLMGNVREMDELVCAAWGPIMQKYLDAPEPDPDIFM